MFNIIKNIKHNDINATFIKNQKGVSMIMLVIAVLMMIIIASIAVYNAPKSRDEANFVKDYASLKAVKEACENALYLIEINPAEYSEYYFFGNNMQFNVENDVIDMEMSEIAQKCGLTSQNDFSSRTYIISGGITDEEKRTLKRLELKDIEDMYVVDLENAKYYILNGIERENDETLYEYQDILLSYKMLTE